MAKADTRVRTLPTLALPVLLVLSVSGCRSAGAPGAVGTRATGIQVLLRVEAELDGDRESFRAVVRRWSGGELELRVNDPLGRSVWRIEVVEGEGRWTDRDGASCRVGERLEAPVFGVAWPISAGELGRWLLGETPLNGLEPGRTEVSDGSRRWTFGWSGGSLTGWELVDVDGTRLVASRVGGRTTLRLPAARIGLEWRESRREALRDLPAPTLAGDDLPECADAAVS